jgi:hypothetical protein
MYRSCLIINNNKIDSKANDYEKRGGGLIDTRSHTHAHKHLSRVYSQQRFS